MIWNNIKLDWPAIILIYLFLIAAGLWFLPLQSHIPSRSRDNLRIYDGYRTPAYILRGLAIAESDEQDNAIGDKRISRGRMQLNMKYDGERIIKWGIFNPFYSNDAIRIASCIYQENLAYFENEYFAIAAFRQGIRGILRNGPAQWYVNRVLQGGMK